MTRPTRRSLGWIAASLLLVAPAWAQERLPEAPARAASSPRPLFTRPAPSPHPVATPRSGATPRPGVTPYPVATPRPGATPPPVFGPTPGPAGARFGPAPGPSAPNGRPRRPDLSGPAGRPSPLPTPPGARTPAWPGFPGWGSPPPVPPPPSVGPGFAPASGPSLEPLKDGPRKGAVRLLSQNLVFDRKASMATLTGRVKVFQEDTTIETERLRHDTKNKVSHIEVPFTLDQDKEGEPPTHLSGDKMTFYHNEKRVYVEGRVKLLRKGNPEARPQAPTKRDKLKAALKREDTYILSERMTYWTDRKDADFVGTVSVYQREKKAEGDHALMDQKRKKIFMDGHVVLTQIKGDWLVEAGLVDDSEPDPERDKAIKEKTVATGDQLEIDQVTNDSVLTGERVVITQKDRKATGKRAVYSDKDQTMTLTEDVKIERELGDWMTADKAVFHTNNDKFEAYGGKDQVETEFKLEDQPAAKPAPQK